MIRAIAFAFALTFGVSAPPLANSPQKESVVLVTASAAPGIEYAFEPCPVSLTEIIVTITDKPVAKAKVKAKKKKRPQFKTDDKQKKKFAAHINTTKQKDKKTDHHKSNVPDHHKSQTPNPSSHGPLHLTSPPGCA